MAEPSVADLVRSFELHLRAENKAGRTIETYLDALRLAAQFLAARRVELDQARREDIEAFIADQLALWKPATAANRYRSLACVLRLAGGRRRNPCQPNGKDATAIAAGDFQQAADRYVQIGSLPDEAFARLRAAEQLLSAGRRADAKVQLQRALAFYRQVGAAGYLREVDALFAASA